MELFDEFVKDIGEAAATGPGPSPGQKVANSLSPGFPHFVRERARMLLHDHSHGQIEQVADLFKHVRLQFLEEDAKLTNVVVPNYNAEAVTAVAADCAKTRHELLEALQIKVNALIRANIK
jgi:hypothetical protein